MSDFDDFMQRQVEAFATKMSRRRFAKVMGKVGLLLMGAAAGSDLLPTDKRPADANSNACDIWWYCGMCGVICCDDCGDGGSPSICPSGTSYGNSWTVCCHNTTGGGWWKMNYVDCCGGNLSCSTCERCCPGSQQINWCLGSSSTVYRCTIRQNLGPC